MKVLRSDTQYESLPILTTSGFSLEHTLRLFHHHASEPAAASEIARRTVSDLPRRFIALTPAEVGELPCPPAGGSPPRRLRDARRSIASPVRNPESDVSSSLAVETATKTGPARA